MKILGISGGTKNGNNDAMCKEALMGAKEAGEGPAAPVAPAIANAVNMATGVYFTELPLDPEHIWRALHGMKDDRNSK